MGNNLTIKNWNSDEQPREKLIKHGAETLSNSELLAILLATGTKEMSALDVSRKLVESAENSIGNLAQKNIKELMKIKGIGPAKALTLSAAFELGKRRKSEQANNNKISSSKDIFEQFHPLVEDLKIEEFWVILLNKANRIIGKKRISQGGVSSTIVDVKVVLKYALDELASSVIVFHNHPSQNIQASLEDKKITQKIKQALQMVDIQLLDHLIMSSKEYLSFADEGLL